MWDNVLAAVFILSILNCDLCLSHYITCDGGIVTKEYIEKLQKQNKSRCEIFNGSLVFKDIEINESNEIDLKVFSHARTLKGSLIVQHCYFQNLAFLSALHTINASNVQGAPLKISDNPRLVFLGLNLEEIIGNEPIVIKNRYVLSDLSSIEHVYNDIQFELDDKCEGGKMNESYLRFLEEEKTCLKIKGDLIIKNFEGQPQSIAALEKVEEIEGALIFENNIGFDSLDFFKNLRRIGGKNTQGPAFKIVHNRGLFGIGLKNLAWIGGKRNKVIPIWNRLPLEESDLQTIRKAYRGGKVDYQQIGTEAKEFNDNTSLGLTVIIVAFSVLSFVGYGGAYIIYLWEEQQAVLKEQQELQHTNTIFKGSATRTPMSDGNGSKQR